MTFFNCIQKLLKCGSLSAIKLQEGKHIFVRAMSPFSYHSKSVILSDVWHLSTRWIVPNKKPVHWKSSVQQIHLPAKD